MPLYVSDEDIDTYAHEDVAVALWAIKLHTSDMAVTPAVALGMLKQYLQPLIPPEHRHLLYRDRVATWDNIWHIYSSLGLSLGEANNPLLFEVVEAIHLIYEHTTQPPREYTFPTVIEVTYFFSMCGQLQIPLEPLMRLESGGQINPFHFCTLCWRHPLPGRKLCAHHAPNTPFQIDAGTGTAAARYKSGVRQKERFDKAVNRLLTKEVTEFHEGMFTPKVLLPEHDIAPWLKERRPLLWTLLEEQFATFSDENALHMLIDVLHTSDGLPPKAHRAYTQINQHLCKYPLLIWPMLIRAEGWYRSREELQEKWGGKRVGAGRTAK